MEILTMTPTHKRIKVEVTPKSPEGIHRLQLIHTPVDKQTQQQTLLHQLPMGQIYPLTHLPLRVTQLCLKTFVAWV